MDEEERRSKVLAGKEALLAYQKKKKKGKHKKKPAVSEVDVSLGSSALSEPASSVGLPDLHPEPDTSVQHGNTISSILHDGLNGCENIGLQTTASLPPTLTSHGDEVHMIDPSLPASTHQLYQNSTGTGSETDHRLMMDQSDMPDGAAERHNSSIPPATSIPSSISNEELERQLKAAVDSQQQVQNDLKLSQSREIKLQNELNALHENHLTALEHAKREEANRYEAHIAVLQSSLMQTERSLQDLEKELSNAKTSHASEIEQLLQTQENIRQTMLKEQDQKHAEHIARITQEMLNQQDIAGAERTGKDEDELEAERLRMIKDKMKEMHEEEKRQINEEHTRELQVVREECQQQLESYRVETEKLVNSKIQEIHGQFMAAHQAVVEQKNASDVALQESTAKLSELQGRCDALVVEKEEVEQQCQFMVVSHSAELERARGDSLSLEQKLNDWKEKAASLESRLQSTHSKSSNELDELRHHSEEELASVRSQYESKIQSLQSLLDDYQSQLQQAEEKHQSALMETEERYQSELDELKGSHANEVSLLETSMAESTSNKASLELAEEHMRELQKQLEGYRRQESDLQSRISQLQHQHNEEVEAMKQRLEAQRVEEVERTSDMFSSQVKELEMQLSRLSAQLEAKQLEDNGQAHEALETLKNQHQKEMSELQSNLLSNREQALEGLSLQLKTAHTEEVAKLKSEHSQELESLKTSLVKEWSSRLDHEKSLLVTELDEVRRSEMTRLDKEHRQTLQKLRDSLSQSGQSAISRAEERANSLEAELNALEKEQSTWESTQQDLLSQLELTQQQLRELASEFEHAKQELKQQYEDCQRYQDQIKSLETNAEASNDEHDQIVQTLSQERDEWKKKVDELHSQIKEHEAIEVSSAKQSQEMAQLTDQIAAKNVTIADLQAQNDMLNTEVFSLTQKCQKHIASSETLQKQLENSWGANEEIETLRQQIEELKIVDENCSVLKEKVNSLELSLSGKTAELKEAQELLERSNENVQAHQQEAEKSAQEMESLRSEVAAGNTKQVVLQQQLNDLQSHFQQITTQNAEGVETIASLRKTIQDLESDVMSTKAAQEEKKANENEELTENLMQLREDYDSLRTERGQLQRELEQLREEHAQALVEQTAKWEERLNEQEKVISSLKAKLEAKDVELAEIQASTTSQDHLGTVIKEKSELEEGLTEARRALTDKLHEKSLLEKELSYHRVELERRLKEKQRLEELLFEKSRFEQELQSQRKQLQDELEEIESRLQLKDVEFQKREEVLRQEHSGELNHLQNDLRQKHQVEVDGMISRHNAELEELNKYLSEIQAELAELKRKLDEKQLNEMATQEESQEGEMAELEPRLKAEQEERISSLEQTLKQQHQVNLEDKIKVERERLESSHQVQMTAMLSVDGQLLVEKINPEQSTELNSSDQCTSSDDIQLVLHDAHQKQLEAMKFGYEREIERLNRQAAQFEEERDQNVSEFQHLQEEVKSLQAQVAELVAGEQRILQQHQRIVDQMNEDKQASLDELERQHKANLNDTVVRLREEMEARITLLQQECQVLQDRFSQSAATEVDNQSHVQAILNEEIAKMQLEYEQKCHESELSYLQKIKRLSEEHDHKEQDLISMYEQKYKLLVSTCEEEKQTLIHKYESEINDLELAQSKRLLELRAEVIQASKDASNSFAEQLEAELKSQREKLEQQHDISLLEQEAKLRTEFSHELEKVRSDYESAHIDAIAMAQSESALRHAVKLEDVRRHLLEEKGKALKEQNKSLEAKFLENLERLKYQDENDLVQKLHCISVEHQRALSAQEADLTASFNAKVVELKEKMSDERKAQLTLAKEHYEQELEKCKTQVRAEVELENSRHIDELLAQCRQESEAEIQTLRENLRQMKEAQEVDQRTSPVTDKTESLKEQYESEIESIKAQYAVELDAKVEEVRKRLVKEHMSKFKDLTDKLQQVHQSELESLKQENEELESKHLEELELLRDELDSNHQQDLSELTATHKQELEGLQESYNERLRQIESEHEQQARQQQDSHLAEKEGREELLREELSQMNQDLEAKLAQLEREKTSYEEKVSSLTEQLSLVQQEAEVANRQLEESRTLMEDIKKQQADSPSCQSGCRHLNRVAELESELREMKEEERERENKSLQEEAVSLSKVHNQLSTVRAERDVLQSTVAALRGALTNSLQLSAVVNSVLSNQKLQQDQSMDTLPENLLVSHHGPEGDAMSQSGIEESSPRHHTLSTLTGSDSPCSISPTDSTGLLKGKRASQGAEVKLTPSVDSGLASHLTSILPSDSDGTLMETPVSSSAGRMIAAIPPGPVPNTPSADVDLTILPLDSTAASPTVLTQIEDVDASQVVSPSFSPSHPQQDAGEVGAAQTLLSVSFLSAGSNQYEELSPHNGALDETLQSEHPPDLSIVPLDTTTSQFDALPLDLAPMTPSLTAVANISDLSSLQAGLSAFHDSVCAMVQQHVTATVQLSEHQRSLSASLSQLSQLQSQLNALELTKVQLQQLLDEKSKEERQKEAQLKLLEAQLSDKTEQLTYAENKIQSLIQQVESGGDGLESELVQETEVLIKKFKDRESLENQLKAELTGREEQVTNLREENQALNDQVNELTGAVEDQNTKLAQVQLECQQAKQDCEAMKDVNRELQSQRELQDLKLSHQIEETNLMKADYEKTLLAKQSEIHELEDMKNRLAAKEEIEEKLVCEKEELMLELNKVQHQLATLQSGVGGRVNVDVVTPETAESMGEAEKELLERELVERTNQCRELKARLEEAEANLNETGQECAQVKAFHSQLSSDLQQLQDNLQKKESFLQTALSEKTIVEQKLDSLRSELEMLKQQLKEMSAQCDENMEQLHSTQEQVAAKDLEIEKLAEEVSLCKSHKQLIEIKKKEVEELVVAKTHLEHQLVSLTETMKEKEEELKMQKSGLENELHHIREQLTLSAKQIELLKNERQMKEKEQLAAKQELQDRLEQLQRDCSELDQRASVETQLRNSHAEELATLQAALERERSGRKKEVNDLKARHSAEIKQLSAEHTRKLDVIQLSHAEDVRHRKEEMEAQYAGELAYLKLHHKEEMGRMQAQHTSEVERIVSDNHRLLSPLKYPARTDISIEDSESELLLMKIAELAPVLAREAHEVNELCKMTGQSSTPLQSEIDQLHARLASEQTLVAELKRELANRDDRLAQSKDEGTDLQRELERLRFNNEELQAELSEARRQLAGMEASMKKATNTVTLLRKELEKSRSRESGLQQSVSEGDVSLAQLRDQVSKESLQNQRLSLELSNIGRHLAGMEERLRASDQAKITLEQNIQQMQREVSEAKKVARESEDALRRKEIELEELLTTKQEGSVQMALQAKEIELTKAMDKLLQEKVAAANANSELTSVTAELTRALAEVENLRRQLDSSRLSEEVEVEGVKDDLDRTLTNNQPLEAKLKKVTDRLEQAESAQSLTSKERDNLQRRYEELRQALRRQLNRSALLKKAYKKEVLDTMDVEEMIDQLLRQEELQCVTQDSLKADKSRLSHEVKRLQQDIDRWKNLEQPHTPGQSRRNGTAHAQPEHKFQEEVMRMFALYRQAEMHRKALVVQKHYLQCQADAFFQTQQSALLLMADMGAPVNLESQPPKSKYPRAYARFRAVGCVVMATLRFHYVLRRKMYHLRSQINKLQRRSHHVGVIPPTVSSSDENTLYRAEGSAVRSERQPSLIGLSTGIQTVLSGQPAIATQHSVSGMISHTGAVATASSLHSYPSLLSASPQHHQHELSHNRPDSHGSPHSPPQRFNGLSTSTGLSHPHSSIKPLHQRQEPQPKPKHRTKVAKASLPFSTVKEKHPSTVTSSPALKPKVTSTKSSAKVVDTPHDPQLTAYIKGLERLKARLSKTSMS